jgi:hypothetical protein
MAARPKVLVTRGDHDSEAIKRLATFCEVEVCPEPRALTRAELLKGVQGKDALLIMPHDKIDQELVTAAGSQLKVTRQMLRKAPRFHGKKSKKKISKKFSK